MSGEDIQILSFEEECAENNHDDQEPDIYENEKVIDLTSVQRNRLPKSSRSINASLEEDDGSCSLTSRDPGRKVSLVVTLSRRKPLVSFSSIRGKTTTEITTCHSRSTEMTMPKNLSSSSVVKTRIEGEITILSDRFDTNIRDMLLDVCQADPVCSVVLELVATCPCILHMIS